MDDVKSYIQAYRSINDMINRFTDMCGRNIKAKNFDLHRNILKIAEMRFIFSSIRLLGNRSSYRRVGCRIVNALPMNPIRLRRVMSN
jgi:hypothetical protein